MNLKELTNLIKEANACYKIYYEESSMMNVRADEIGSDTETDETVDFSNFVHIEEFRDGSYIRENFRRYKQTRVQIYFGKLTRLKSDASAREIIRDEIEAEIVRPFIDLYEARYRNSNNALGISFAYPLPRWDANEVSILLQIQIREMVC